MRVASLIYLTMAIGHTIAHMDTPTGDPADQALAVQMDTVKVDMMGTPRSRWELYEGFSIFLSIDSVCSAAFHCAALVGSCHVVQV